MVKFWQVPALMGQPAYGRWENQVSSVLNSLKAMKMKSRVWLGVTMDSIWHPAVEIKLSGSEK